MKILGFNNFRFSIMLGINCLLLIGVIASCKKDTSTPTLNSTFLGGEIINRNADYVVLYQSEVIDTIKLDRNNRFIYEIPNAKTGLYSFKHAGEFQTLLLEPHDSIIFRLNTLDFDESLVYTGIGAKKNNYLINIFLDYELEEKLVFEYSQLDPIPFEKKLDSLKRNKEKRLLKFNKKNKLTKQFNALARANIDYQYYLGKENYPFLNYKHSDRHNFDVLPETFYNYRNTIDYNNNLLQDYYPYLSFLYTHITNVALQEHFKHSKDSLYNKTSLKFNLEKLNYINEHVSQPYIKNGLLQRSMLDFIKYSKHVDDYDVMLTSYLEKSENTEHKTRVTNIVNSYTRLKPGNPIPDFKVKTSTGKTQSIASLIKKPTVLYFWSDQNKNHLIESHNKSTELKAKYPEVNFISINIDDKTQTAWKTFIQNYKMNPQSEFLLDNTNTIELLSINPINKVFILDANTNIINAKANMFSIGFEQELLGLLNK